MRSPRTKQFKIEPKIFLIFIIATYFLILLLSISSKIENFARYELLVYLIFFMVQPVLVYVAKRDNLVKLTIQLLIITALNITIYEYLFPGSYLAFNSFSEAKTILSFVIFCFYITSSVTFFKSLTKSNNITEDPRIRILKNETKLLSESLLKSLIAASEVTNWYYAFGNFRKDCDYQLKRKYGPMFIFVVSITVIIATIICSYFYIYNKNFILGIGVIIAAIAFIPTILANFNISKYRSIYIEDSFLIINPTIFSFMAIPIKDISELKIFSGSAQAEGKIIGDVSKSHFEFSFTRDISVFRFFGLTKSDVKKISIGISNSNCLTTRLYLESDNICISYS